MTAIVKILHQGMKRLFNKKGQGLVEFALILAFCVGVGLAARDAGLLDAFSDSFNQGVLAFLNSDVDEKTTSGNGSGNSGGSTSGNGSESGGEGNSGESGSGSGNGNSGGSGGNNTGGNETGSGSNNNYAAALANLAGFSKDEIKNELSQEARIKLDQEALAKIGKFFLGMSTDNTSPNYISNYLRNYNKSSPSYNLWIVNYHDNGAAEAKEFETDFNYKNDSGNYDSQLQKSYADIVTILRGGTPDGTATGATQVVSKEKFFFSDNMLNDKSGKWGSDRSIRINLHFKKIKNEQNENVYIVDAVRVKINRGSSNDGNENTKNYYRELDVKVGEGVDWKPTFGLGAEPGAINKKTSDTVGDSQYAWYDLSNW